MLVPAIERDHERLKWDMKNVPGSVQFSPEWRGGNLGPMWRDNSHGRTPDTLLCSVRSCWRSSRTDLVWLTGCRWSQSSKNADSGKEHESNARRSTAPHQNRPVIQWQNLVLFRTRKDRTPAQRIGQTLPNSWPERHAPSIPESTAESFKPVIRRPAHAVYGLEGR